MTSKERYNKISLSIGLPGQILAMIISWGLEHSIGWAIWHGMLGWIYVIYHWIIGVY